MCFVDLFELRQLDAWTAKLFAKKSLRNRFGNHSLTISCRDLGSPAHTVSKTLDICVADFNDHPPAFVSPLHNTTIRIPEVSHLQNMCSNNVVLTKLCFLRTQPLEVL